MSRFKKIALITLAVIAIVIGTLWLIFPDRTALFFAVIYSNIVANHNPPPVTEGVITDKDWLKWDEASQKLTAVLQKEFPPGTQEKTLRSTLLDQGFRADPPPSPDCIPPSQPKPYNRSFETCPEDDSWKRTLRYAWGGLPCEQDVTVWWSTDNHGKITSIKGGYGGACL